MMPYRPTGWYWTIGSNTEEVFSSSTMTFVPYDDTAYLAWKDQGGATSHCPTGTALYSVLAAQALPIILAAGVELHSTGTPALNAVYPLDPTAQSQITGVAASIAAGRGVPGGGSTFIYNGIEFTAEQFLDVATALEDFVYNYNLGLGTYLASDGASGSLPTTPITIA